MDTLLIVVSSPSTGRQVSPPSLLRKMPLSTAASTTSLSLRVGSTSTAFTCLKEPLRVYSCGSLMVVLARWLQLCPPSVLLKMPSPGSKALKLVPLTTP